MINTTVTSPPRVDYSTYKTTALDPAECASFGPSEDLSMQCRINRLYYISNEIIDKINALNELFYGPKIDSVCAGAAVSPKDPPTYSITDLVTKTNSNLENIDDMLALFCAKMGV